MALIESTDTPEDLERLLRLAREKLEAFEAAVDGKRLLARVKRASPAHPVLVVRGFFLFLGVVFLVCMFAVVAAGILHGPSAELLYGLDRKLGIPGGMPAVCMVLALCMFVGYAMLTMAARFIGRESPMLPWEAKEHQKLVNEVTRLTTQKAVMERIKQTPGTARPRISTPVPMSMRGSQGGGGGFGGLANRSSSAPSYLNDSPSPSYGAPGQGGGGFGSREAPPSAPAYGQPTGGFGANPAAAAPSFGSFGRQPAAPPPAPAAVQAPAQVKAPAASGGSLLDRARAGRPAASPSFGQSTDYGNDFGGAPSPTGGGFGSGFHTEPSAPAPPAFAAPSNSFPPPSGFNNEGSGYRTPAAERPSFGVPADNGNFGGGGGGFGQPERPAFGSQPERPAFGSQPERPAFGSQPERPAFGAQPERPAFGSQPERPAFGSQPERPAFGAPPEPSFGGGSGFGSGNGLGASTRGGTPLGAPPRAGVSLRQPSLTSPRFGQAAPAFGSPRPTEPTPSYDDYAHDDPGGFDLVDDNPIEEEPTAKVGIQMMVKKTTVPEPVVPSGLDFGDIVETAVGKVVQVEEEDIGARSGMPTWGRIDEIWLEEALEKAESMVNAFPDQARLAFSVEQDLPFTLVIERATPAMAVRAMVSFIEFLAAIYTPKFARIQLIKVAHLDRSFHRNVDAALQPYFAGKVRVENNPGQIDIIFSDPDPGWDEYPTLPME